MKQIIVFSMLIFFVACQSEPTKNTDNKTDSIVAPIDTLNMLSLKIETHSEIAENWVNRADYFFELGNLNKAKKDYEEAILLDSTNSEYRYKYGNILIGFLDLAGAKYNFEYAIKEDSLCADAYVGLGRVFALLDNSGMATVYLNKAYNINKNLPEAYFLEGMIYRSDFDKTKRQESWKRAKSSFQTAVEQNPKFYNAYIMLGVMSMAEDNDATIDYFNSALDIAPQSTEAWYYKGMFYQQKKQYSRAKYCYQKIIKYDTTSFDAYYNQGYIQNGIDKNYDSAIYFFEKAILIDSLSANAYNNLGLAHEYNNENTLAIKFYKKAITLNPNFDLAKKNLKIITNK